MKSEFRRLNLALKFTPVEAEPRAHFVVEGQCDLSALAFSVVRAAARGQGSAGWVWRAGGQSAPVDRLGAARNSEWVAKEIDYALGRKGGDELAAPEIVPIMIEGPPPVPPPPALRHMHFNDPFLYFIQSDAPRSGR